MKKRISILSICLLIGCTLAAQAQGYKWFDPKQAKFQVVEGQAFAQECPDHYMRFPRNRQGVVPDGVWWNSTHSAGLTLRFHTLSPEIQVRYVVPDRNFAMPHMPSMGKSGVDLFELDSKGKTHYCAPAYAFGDTVTFTFSALDHPFGGDYELYFPLYNGVDWMNIGVPEGQDFQFLPASKEKPILVYGTSIAHGGCASRTGMAWTAIVKRELNLPMINWGFSGCGKLESVMFDQMAMVDARLYIIDCMPNMPDIPQEVVPRMTEGIRRMRAKTDAPILIVEHDGYGGKTESKKRFDSFNNTNIECKKAYAILKKEGVKGLYYLSCEDIAMPEDAQVDGCHATDYGMMVYAKAYLKKIKKILK